MADAAKRPPEDDLPQRLEGFNKELAQLLGKFELAVGAQASLTQDGRVAAQVVLVSARQLPKEKPIPSDDGQPLAEG